MWRTGQISGVVPQSRRERLRLCWVVVGAVNFVALSHTLLGTARAHCWQREISGRATIWLFPMARIFPLRQELLVQLLARCCLVTVHLVVMLAVWGLRRSGDLQMNQHRPKLLEATATRLLVLRRGNHCSRLRRGTVPAAVVER